MSTTLDIVEVGPRDGLQAEAHVLPVPVRAELIRRLAATGVRRIEAVSFVRPDRVPQMAGAEETLAQARASVGGEVSLIGLVLNERGLDRAIEAGVSEVNTVIAATDSFARSNQGRSLDELVDACIAVCHRARAAGIPVSVTVSTSFGCPYEGEVPVADVVSIVERIAAAGPDELSLADTIGSAVPADVVERFSAVLPVIEENGITPRCHFHDTRNTAIANVTAAVGLGIGVIDASIAGLGGCPFAPGASGNVATEDVLYLASRSGWACEVDLRAVLDLVPWVAEQVDHRVSSSLAVAGEFPQTSGGPSVGG